MTREQAILRMVDELDAVGGMHGLILTLRGRTLAEGYWSPYSAGRMHRLYSVSKSVVSLAIGLLVGDGALSLDARICPFFPEWTGAHTPPRLRAVTIRDMLRMATCYDRAMYSPLGDADWTRPFFFGKPTHPAGTLFHYDTSASQVLCALVERLTGTDILSFMRARLFAPIGMDGPMKWLRDGVGTSQGGTGLLMTLRDFAKLANFVMGDGGGLIDPAYLRAATGWQIATDERSAPEERFGYGYQFWRMRKGFSMYGLGGQMALCLPEQGLSLVTTADRMLSTTGVQPIYDAFFRHADGLDGLPHSEADAALLASRLASLRVPPVQGSMAQSVRLTLEPSSLPFTALTIDPDGVTFSLPDGDAHLPCFPGEWTHSIFPGSDHPCIASAGWASHDRFVLRAELCGDFTCGIALYLTRNGSQAALRVRSSMWECIPGWDGLGAGVML